MQNASGSVGTTVQSIKATQTRLRMLDLGNNNAAVSYVQLFDAATPGAVTLGTTVPVFSFEIPANFARPVALPSEGLPFAKGIQVAATTTRAGAVAPAATVDWNAAFE